MTVHLKVSSDIQNLFRCPLENGELLLENDHCICRSCGTVFPIVDTIPILINEKNSVFKIKDFVSRADTFFRTKPKLIEWVHNLTPKISANYMAQSNYEKIERILLKKNNPLKILVLGGSIIGGGLRTLLDNHLLKWLKQIFQWDRGQWWYAMHMICLLRIKHLTV